MLESRGADLEHCFEAFADEVFKWFWEKVANEQADQHDSYFSSGETVT